MTPSVRAPGHAATPGTGGASVLVVEDDRGIATQLVRGLSRNGYAVEHVTTGGDALSRADPDVVLLDLGLPDGDGVDICRRLRQRSGVAIIVVTARGEEPERVLALDAGADDYMVKPFGLAELLARIRAVLRRVHPGDGVSTRDSDGLEELRPAAVRKPPYRQPVGLDAAELGGGFLGDPAPDRQRPRA